MPYKHKQYTTEHIATLLIGDEGQNMNNGAPPPHALGLHGTATDAEMLARVDGGSATKTSRFVEVKDMLSAILEALLSNQGQNLLGQLDAGSNWVDGTFALSKFYDYYTVYSVIGVPVPSKNPVFYNGSNFYFDVNQTNKIYLKLRRTPGDEHFPVIQTCYPKP